MDILGTARKLEAALSERLDRAAARVRTPGPREPLEVLHAILDAVARHVQPGGRGRFVFPYNRIKVSVAASSRDARAQLESVLDGDPSLGDRIAERLIAAGCDARDLDVRTTYVAAASENWTDPAFHLELHRLAERRETSRRHEMPTPLKLSVEH